MPGFSWDPISKRYKDPQGHFFPEREVKKLLNIAIDHKMVTNLTMDYVNGRITKETWHDAMRASIKRAYLQAGMLAAGGKDAMTPQLYGKIGGHVAEQFYHLDRKANNFFNAIDDLTPAQAVARAKMYIESCRQVYEEIYRDIKMELGAVLERWLISYKKEHCRDCIELASMGIVPIGTLGTVPGAGETQCLTTCGCSIRYYRQDRRALREWISLGGKRSGHHGHAGIPGHRGGSASRGIIEYAFPSTKAELNSIYDEINTTWEGGRKTFGLDAVNGALSGDKLVISKEGSEVVGVAAYSIGDDIEILDFATKRSGYGRSLMGKMFEIAADNDISGIVVQSTPESEGFYMTMGFYKIGTDTYATDVFSEFTPLTTTEVISYMHSTNEPFDIYLDAPIGGVVVPHKQLNEHFVVKLGGKGSGHYGHGGRPGEVGGSAPNASIVTIYDRYNNKLDIFSARSGEYIPSGILDKPKLTILGTKHGDIYVAPEYILHADLVDGLKKANIVELDHDSVYRISVWKHVLVISSNTMGVGYVSSRSDVDTDAKAFRNFDRFGPNLLGIGISPTIPIEWELADGSIMSGITLGQFLDKKSLSDYILYSPIAISDSIRFMLSTNEPFDIYLDTPIGDVVVPHKALNTHFISKLGSAKSGNYGHKGRPGQVGGSLPRSAAFLTSAAGWEDVPERTKEFLMRDLSKIPDEHLENLTIIYGDWEGRMLYKPFDQTLTVDPNRALPGDLIHDVGHHVHDKFLTRPQKELVEKERAASSSTSIEGKFLAWDDEMFAELYKFYNQGVVFDEFPVTNSLIKSVIEHPPKPRPSGFLGVPHKQLNEQFVSKLGGPGSGHRGHKGIPGQVGGSLPKGNKSILSLLSGRTIEVSIFNVRDLGGSFWVDAKGDFLWAGRDKAHHNITEPIQRELGGDIDKDIVRAGAIRFFSHRNSIGIMFDLLHVSRKAKESIRDLLGIENYRNIVFEDLITGKNGSGEDTLFHLFGVSPLSAKASPTYISLGEGHAGVMVAFHIPGDIAKKLELPDGLSAKEMHITLTYMGDSGELGNKDEIIEQLELFSGSHGPISGRINGFGRFMASKSSDERDVIYATFDSPDLPQFRQDLALSINHKEQGHGFIPHITLAYTPSAEETPIDKIEKFELTFDAIYLHWGDEITEFKLDGG